MSAKTDEQKFSDMLVKYLGQMGMNDHMTVINYLQKSEAYQLRMMDLVVAFLNAWDGRYTSGYWDDAPDMQNLGEMANCMLAACTGGKHGTGLHHRNPA